MFDMPYFNLYKSMHRTRHPKVSKSTVLHQKTCPVCDSKRVNVYYSNQLETHICKKCTDKLAGADMRGEKE